MVYESESRTMKISLPKAFLTELEKLGDELDTGISKLFQYAILEWLGKEKYLGKKFTRLYSRFESLVGMLETEAEEVKPNIADFIPFLDKFEREKVGTPTTSIPKELKDDFMEVKEKLDLDRNQVMSLLLAIAFNSTGGIVDEENIPESGKEDEEEEESGKEA